MEKKTINGHNVKLYRCSNNKVYTEDGELWEPTEDATCSYALWGNKLLKYGKRSIETKEVKQLLQEGQTTVRLVSRGSKNVYYKYMIPDIEFGAQILWDEEVDE